MIFLGSVTSSAPPPRAGEVDAIHILHVALFSLYGEQSDTLGFRMPCWSADVLELIYESRWLRLPSPNRDGSGTGNKNDI